MDTSNFIRTGDFCEIVSDKFTEQTGVKRGHIVYVAGHKALPEDESDPYTQRIKFFVNLVSNDGHVDGGQLYLVDPKSLLKVGKSKQKKLLKMAKTDHEAK
jgi:hypothetical protein